MFSWLVSSLFAILHTDLQLLCHFTARNGNVVLMDIMCDMTQFIIVVLVSNKIVAILAEYFMQHVLLKFGICRLVSLDDDV